MEPTTTPNPNPAPTPEPSAAPQASDWFAHVPKGSEKIFEPYKGKPISDVLNSHVEAQKMIGSSIRLPNEKDTPEVREAKLKDIRAKIGLNVPESADKYDLGELPKVEGFQWDDSKLASAKAEMHKAGFTNEQVKTALKLFSEQASALNQPLNPEESKAKLIEEYGSEAMYTRNMAAAQKAVRQFGDEEFVQWFEQTGLGNHPSFVKFVAKIGRELSEHGSTDAATTNIMTAAEAQKKIHEILNDKTDVYHSRMGTPGRKERIDEVLDLHRIISGEA